MRRSVPIAPFQYSRSASRNRLSTDYSAIGRDILPGDPARRFADQEGNDFGNFFRLPGD
jgi:hypothetical protein